MGTEALVVPTKIFLWLVPEGRGEGGQLLHEAEAIPGCLLPSWELALGPLLRVHIIP